jgi:hypothetical protein
LLRSVVEKAFQVWPALDYGSRTFLQLALYPLKKWNSYFHVQALVQRDFVGCVAQLWVRFQDFVDPVAQARIPLSQLVRGPRLSQSCRLRWKQALFPQTCQVSRKRPAEAATRNSGFAVCRGNQAAGSAALQAAVRP